MLPKAFLAAALATSTASAFLLPPPPTDAVADVDGHEEASGSSGVAFAGPFYRDASKVKVPCPGCSMQVREHREHEHHEHHDEDEAAEDADAKIITLTDVPNHIDLFVKIDHAADHDRLLVNGLELYPDVDMSGFLTAVQVPDHVHHKGKHHEDGEEKDGKEGKAGEENKAEHDKEHKDEDEEHKDKDDEELKKRHRRHRKHRKHHASDDDDEHHDMHHGEHHRGRHGKHLVKVPLGFSMRMEAVGQDASNGLAVDALTLQIIEVNNVFVQGIPAVHMRLIRTPEGGLMLAQIDVEGEDNHEHEHEGAQPPRKHGHGRPPSDKERMDALRAELDACSSLLCRWKAVIAWRIRAHHGGCAGKAMAKATGASQDAEDAEDGTGRHHAHAHPPPHSPHAPHRPHPHHHHDHHHRRPHRQVWLHLAKMFLVGIVVGLLAGAVGIAVGTAVISLWRLVFRRNKATSATAALRCAHSGSRSAPAASPETRHAGEDAVDEEKTGLMETESAEALPPYQDDKN